MLSLQGIKITLTYSHITILCQKCPCKVNQSLFEGWDQQKRPQIVVLQKNLSRLDSTQMKDILNATWKIKPKLNHYLHEKLETEPKLKIPNRYSSSGMFRCSTGVRVTPCFKFTYQTAIEAEEQMMIPSRLAVNVMLTVASVRDVLKHISCDSVWNMR